jgi:hypothetical protein
MLRKNWEKNSINSLKKIPKNKPNQGAERLLQ